MIVAFVLAGLLALDVCDACRVEGTAVKLCAPHASSEKTAVTWCGKGLRSKREEERIAALEKIAAETDAHVNAPSARIVDMLRRGTKDDSLAVRRRAVELLGPPQHGPAALEALIDLLGSHEEEMVSLSRERARLKPRKSDPRDLSLDGLDEIVDLNARYLVELAWGGMIVQQLGKFPDDAATDAILGSRYAVAAPFAHRALIALGSAPAIRGAITHLGGVQDSLGSRPEALRDVEAQEKELRAFHDDLAAFAAVRGLPVPDWNAEDPAAVWKAWLAEHEAAFPEHLPGVRSPAW